MNKKERFESKLKEIVEIDDTWEVKTFYGKTTYYTFLNNAYCVSRCEHNKNNMISIVFSKDDEIVYQGYQGFVEEKVLKLIEELVHKEKEKC